MDMPDMFFRKFVQFGMDSIVKDATTGLGPEGTQAAYTNYEFIATDVLTPEEIITSLEQNVPINKI